MENTPVGAATTVGMAIGGPWRGRMVDRMGLRRALAPGLANREDLLAEELRLAARALGCLTGRVDVDDVLDVIFRDFCIGK